MKLKVQSHTNCLLENNCITPKVSIIVPVYNVEKYIRRCIESILQQRIVDFQLILVDDGSTDCSGRICDDYAKRDKRIHVVHQENGGVSVARNTGLRLATGKYIAFCDSDDYCMPAWLENLVIEAEDCDADYVCSNYYILNEDGAKLGTGKRFYGKWRLQTSRERIDYCVNHVLDKKEKWNGWTLWTSLFRNEIIKNNNIAFNVNCGNFAEDMGFVLEYLLYCNAISSIESCEYNYVQHPKSMMANSINTVKLDSLNEVSIQFGKRFFQEVKTQDDRKLYPILHFLILNDQYEKIKYEESTKRLSEEVGKIRNKEWFRKYLIEIKRCKKELNLYFDKKQIVEYMLWNRYCLHLNWKRFSMESVIVYRLIIRWLIHL